MATTAKRTQTSKTPHHDRRRRSRRTTTTTQRQRAGAGGRHQGAHRRRRDRAPGRRARGRRSRRRRADRARPCRGRRRAVDQHREAREGAEDAPHAGHPRAQQVRAPRRPGSSQGRAARPLDPQPGRARGQARRRDVENEVKQNRDHRREGDQARPRRPGVDKARTRRRSFVSRPLSPGRLERLAARRSCPLHSLAGRTATSPPRPTGPWPVGLFIRVPPKPAARPTFRSARPAGRLLEWVSCPRMSRSPRPCARSSTPSCGGRSSTSAWFARSRSATAARSRSSSR